MSPKRGTRVASHCVLFIAHRLCASGPCSVSPDTGVAVTLTTCGQHYDKVQPALRPRATSTKREHTEPWRNHRLNLRRDHWQKL
jgi:hypothetical protein